MDRIRVAQKKYEETLVQLEQKQDLWSNYERDYTSLTETLNDLVNKTRQDIMIPITKMAFMRGELVHTNEYLVMLGSDYFVERSAKQTNEIIERRLEFVSKKKEDVGKQIESFTERLEAANDLMAPALNEDGEEIIEIQEFEDDEGNMTSNRIAHTPSGKQTETSVISKQEIELERELENTTIFDKLPDKKKTNQAFGGNIVERTESLSLGPNFPKDSAEDICEQQPPKRISKFKANRNKMN